MALDREQGRTALITGASRRIGRAIALSLADEGWDIAIHYGSQADAADALRAEIVAGGRKAAILSANLENARETSMLVGAAADALGPLTCLINNASLFIEDDAISLDPDVWDRQIAANLRAPMLLARDFARQLPEGSEGCIINMIDQRVLAPTPDFFSYAISKAGLHAATRMLAQAFAPRIRVNGIGPGPVLQSVYQSPEDFAAEARSTLLGRPSSPDEIARTVRFILDAPSLTGQMIAIDSGQHLTRTELHTTKNRTSQ